MEPIVFTNELKFKDIFELDYESMHEDGMKLHLDIADMRIRSIAGINDVAELRDRVHRLIYLNSLRGRATSLGEINRLYNRAAKRLGASLMDLVMGLMSEDHVERLTSGDHNGYFAKVLGVQMREMWSEDKAWDLSLNAIRNMRSAASTKS